MNVLFVNPPYLTGFSRGQRSPQVSIGGSMYYPYWLAYAAGALEENSFRVGILDAPARRLEKEATLQETSSFNPRLVVLDTSTASITNDLDFAFAIKEISPDISLGLVGPHATIRADEILREEKQVDWIARREFDYTVLETARAIDEGKDLEKVEGLSYRRSERVFHNPDRGYIEDLDKLPFASRVYKKHLNIRDYCFIPALYPMVMIMTGRGCIFRCFFCLWPQTMYGRNYRARSPDSVIEEMMYIKKDLPEVREVVFEDDSFSADISRVRKISELIIKNKINIPWFANIRSDIDFDTLKLMKQAGLHSAAVGYESANQDTLDFMKKDITIEQSLRFSRNARKLGIIIHGCFMVGFKGETKRSMEETFKFAKKLKCDSAQFYPVLCYPGTEAYQWAEKDGLIKTNRYNEWIGQDGSVRAVHNLSGLTSQEMSSFSKKAYLRYHFSPIFLLRKFWQLMFNRLERSRTLFYGKRFIYQLLKWKN